MEKTPADEVVERVAAAIYAVNPEMRGEVYRDSELNDPGAPMSWEDFAAEPHNGLADVIRAEARAAIEAMRDPTEAMLVAARDPIWGFSQDYAPSEADPEGATEDSAEWVARRAFRAMIDAALANH